MLNILDFGADTTGKIFCTDTIQKAIDELAGRGGGTLYFPAGIYLTGTIRLRSHCRLYLDSGATLLASVDISDYAYSKREIYWLGTCGTPPWKKYYALLLADDEEDIVVEGAGCIDGRGKYGEFFPNSNDCNALRPFLCLFYHCKSIKLEGITLKDSAAYAFLGIACDNVRLTGLRVRTYDSGNGDGLDFDGGTNIVISDCLLETGDDSISLKTTDKVPLQNVSITNCVMRSRWAAVRIGIESTDDIRNITVGNCIFRDCRDGIKVQNCGGAVYESLLFHDIVMDGVLRPIFVTLNRFRFSTRENGVRPPVGRICGLRIQNVTAVVPVGGSGFEQIGCAITGIPEGKIESVFIQNFYADFRRSVSGPVLPATPELLDFSERYPEIDNLGELPAAALYLRHIRRARLSECEFLVSEEDVRPTLFWTDTGLEFSGKLPEQTGKWRDGSSLSLTEQEAKTLRETAISARKADLLLEERAELLERVTGKAIPDTGRQVMTRIEKEYILISGNRRRGERWLYFPGLKGNFLIEESESGRQIESWRCPKPYLYRAPYLLDLSGLPEDFRIRLTWLETGEMFGTPFFLKEEI